MNLSLLLAQLGEYEVNGPVYGTIAGLAYNSKTVKSGELFFCLRGNRTDGHFFAVEAVLRGATALVVEEFLPLTVLQVKVPDSRSAMRQLGRHFFGNPAASLGLIGVTGTNGKTTTTFYIRSILQAAGLCTGLIGTVYNQFSGPTAPSQLTTPESLDLWPMLAQARREECSWLVMEVSSHALAMERVDPRDIDIAVMTNITRDHFEFHGTFEHYLQSKQRLVKAMCPEEKEGLPKAAILNADDRWVKAVAEEAPVPVLSYSMVDERADVYATDLGVGPEGSRFMLRLPGAAPEPVYLRMPGGFNVANALAAAAVGWRLGLAPAVIAAGLFACDQVPGRVERIDEGQEFEVIVDFAHNPDALAKILTLQPRGGRRILVFGAEGGKDRGKRAQMGAAARAADVVVITSDNTPKEEPEQVAREIAVGLAERPCEIILDRRRAIARAIEIALPGDLVIIAGKGHEGTWVVGEQQIPFDDRSVAREILQERRSILRT